MRHLQNTYESKKKTGKKHKIELNPIGHDSDKIEETAEDKMLKKKGTKNKKMTGMNPEDMQ